MNLLAVSINHKTASVELREALYLTQDEIASFAQKAKDKFFTEGLVVSTCNRTEIYGIPVDPETTVADIQKYLIEHKSVSGFKLRTFSIISGKNCVKAFIQCSLPGLNLFSSGTTRFSNK